MLHLNGGAPTTDLDWTKIQADMSHLKGDNIKSYEPLGQVLMKNANGINLTSYTGAIERSY